ncbi:transcriptional regulator [Caulobacter henricii]|uniref:HTH iclR-type domain-containing protein n=1 Tax=Caulobacter henricii TaxID=69395 RepID=A0A0P0P204_9CAUL|nr:transcriptional regulator [Caulobacter henricii]ALL14587.1 hypothetical protein AQ619_15195 [Caulobacter henricii]
MKRSSTPFLNRHQLSLGADYALRLIRIFSDVFDGDLGLALVFITAAQAGTEHLRERDDYVDLITGEFFPDDLRRPISVSALSRAVGLPVETTRRHVVKLAASGFVERTGSGGVLVTSACLTRDEIREAGLLNQSAMAVLVKSLKRAPRNR